MPHIEFYETETGRSPVEEYIAEAPKRDQGKIINVIDQLEEHGLALLDSPFADQLTRRFYGLRARGEQFHRIIFCHVAKFGFLLLHAFSKKSNQTPAKELATAEQRLANWLARHEKTGDR